MTAAVDKMAEVAPHIQDEFDIQEGVMQELDVADRPENQVQPPDVDPATSWDSPVTVFEAHWASGSTTCCRRNCDGGCPVWRSRS